MRKTLMVAVVVNAALALMTLIGMASGHDDKRLYEIIEQQRGIIQSYERTVAGYQGEYKKLLTECQNRTAKYQQWIIDLKTQ